VMIDLSHANSSKQFEKQMDAGMDVARQIAAGDARIVGVMAESHLKAGRQDLVPGKSLVYGQSITDACLGWDDSRQLLESLAHAVAERRLKNAQDLAPRRNPFHSAYARHATEAPCNSRHKPNAVR
jgi:3-deoxy-7-phosphoheptulonate synthase